MPDDSPLDVLLNLIVWAVGAPFRWGLRRLGWRSDPAPAVDDTPRRRDRWRPKGPQSARHVPGYSQREGAFPKAPRDPHPLPAPKPLPVPAAPDPPPPLAYKRAKRLLSEGERAFWYPLFKAVEGRYRVFCKVRLADVVVSPFRQRKGEKGFHSIKGYHVDFVLCDPETTAPLLVVELDDRSHLSDRRQARDRFKNEVLACAGVPVYRVKAQAAYDPIEIADRIASLLAEPREKG